MTNDNDYFEGIYGVSYTDDTPKTEKTDADKIKVDSSERSYSIASTKKPKENKESKTPDEDGYNYPYGF